MIEGVNEYEKVYNYFFKFFNCYNGDKIILNYSRNNSISS